MPQETLRFGIRDILNPESSDGYHYKLLFRLRMNKGQRVREGVGGSKIDIRSDV
jgi:hypothetical protein